MRIKYILVTLVVNAFAITAVSVVQELSRVKDVYPRMSNTVQLAVDMGISNSLASEEFFSDVFDETLASHGQSEDDRYLYSTLQYMRNGSWISGNTYFLSEYYSENHRYPDSQYEYDIFADSKDTKSVYEFIFGNTGSDYDSPSVSWANPWQESYVLDVNARKPTDDFQNFYNSVGSKITSKQFVKVKTADSWDFVELDLPVLMQTGLKLGTGGSPYLTSDPNANIPVFWTTDAVPRQATADNFCEVDKTGRLINANGSLKESTYYLTPYSLGVTYLSPEVLYTNIRLNLENLIRFSKCKQNPDVISIDDINKTYMSADGCIDTKVFDDGSGNPTSIAKSHRESDLESIMNDGEAEYDINSLQVKVDYFLVDFYDDANWKIVNEIEGATPNTLDLDSLPTRLKNTDTSEDKNGNRVVAKVTVKLKVNVPYQSGILQWFVDRTSLNTTEHYGVARWDDASGKIVEDEDGLWYSYTAYTAISR